MRNAHVKRLLLVLGATLALAGIIYAGWIAMITLFVHHLMTADPYPPFMADYHPPRLYPDLERSFDQFVTQRFPSGPSHKTRLRRSALRDSAAAL